MVTASVRRISAVRTLAEFPRLACIRHVAVGRPTTVVYSPSLVAGEQFAAVSLAKARFFDVWPGVRGVRRRPSISIVSPSAEHAVGRLGVECASARGPTGSSRRSAPTIAAASRREKARGGAMVAVRVGAQDRRHGAAADRFHQRVDMLRQVRPGIDHRHLGIADDKSLGAGVSECRWIVREHAGDTRLELFQFGVGSVHARLCTSAPRRKPLNRGPLARSAYFRSRPIELVDRACIGSSALRRSNRDNRCRY